MSPDLPLSRRAALKLGAWGGAGLVASACTRGVGPTTTNPSVGPTMPEQAPLPGRPANVRVSQDGFVAHAEPCLAVNPRDPRNLLGACIAHDDQGGTHIGAYASFDAGASWRSLGGLEDSANGRDPTVTFDATGRGYVCANTDDLHLWPTDDGGRSFGAPVLATRGHKLDHPWLAADPTPGTAIHDPPVWRLDRAGQHPAGVRPVHRRRPQLPGPTRHRHRARSEGGQLRLPDGRGRP